MSACSMLEDPKLHYVINIHVKKGITYSDGEDQVLELSTKNIQFVQP